jgi:hypothetical protein
MVQLVLGLSWLISHSKKSITFFAISSSFKHSSACVNSRGAPRRLLSEIKVLSIDLLLNESSRAKERIWWQTAWSSWAAAMSDKKYSFIGGRLKRLRSSSSEFGRQRGQIHSVSLNCLARQPMMSFFVTTLLQYRQTYVVGYVPGRICFCLIISCPKR